MKKVKGFTLIELMIVVAIIGILAAVAVPKFADLIRKANEGATKGSMSALRSTLSIYYAEQEGIYPATVSTLAISSRYIESIPFCYAAGYHGKLTGEVTDTVSPFVVGDNGKWNYYYVPGNASDGSLAVGCTHTDTRGIVWSTY